MRFLAFFVTSLTVASGCLEDTTSSPPSPDPQSSDTPDTGDASASIEIPDELQLAPAEGSPQALAHANCGHMVFCSSGGRAVYCYYNRASTGCSLQNVQDDFNSDCQYVCGHTACLNASIRPC